MNVCIALARTCCITNGAKRKLLFNCYGERYCDIVATRWLRNYSSWSSVALSTLRRISYGLMQSTFLCEPAPSLKMFWNSWALHGGKSNQFQRICFIRSLFSSFSKNCAASWTRIVACFVWSIIHVTICKYARALRYRVFNAFAM